MARRSISFIEGDYYHIYNRGVNRQAIFFEDANYFYLLKLIGDACVKYSITLIIYCLMPNHYHFLLRQDSDVTISRFVQEIFNRYTKAINKRYKRSGTLFEGPFKAIQIDDEAYLIHLCRYIHRNPIDTHPPLVKRIEDWPYSNYLEWIGSRSGKLIDREFVRSYFVKNEDYVTFVREQPAAKVLNRMEKYALDYDRI